MDTISTSVWQRKGSSVVFDKDSLVPLISSNAMISLREVLSWSKSMPAVPPVPGRTILVSGLETIVETMAPIEAEAFLTQRVRALLIDLQNKWTDCGIVFGFSSHPKTFEETTMDEEVLFQRRDRKTVKLSESLWDGSATVNMKRIVRESEKSGEEVIVGYYVARIS